MMYIYSVVSHLQNGTTHKSATAQSCLLELSEPSDAITVASSVASTSSAISAAAGVGNATSTSVGAQQTVGATHSTAAITGTATNATTASAATNNSSAGGNKRNNSGQNISNNNADSGAAAAVEQPIAADQRPAQANGNATSGGSVIGGITTWMPPTANLTTNRSELDINSTPPQSIAIVAGRKYIMVPKTNLMSVSPSGDVKIGDNNGMPLQYVDESGGASPASK